jgi:hypothetical protein
MIKTITCEGEKYLRLQAEGFAAQYAFPFAKKVFEYSQTIYDVGCNREEWKYPGAKAIDPVLNGYDAMKFPAGVNPDAIFSSHMLEHYQGSWVEVLEYWKSQLCQSGILFLYLPHYSQRYWRPWNNKKHIHCFTPELIRDYLMANGWINIFVSEGYDLNNSFYAVAEKA